MPKPARNILLWSREDNTYQLVNSQEERVLEAEDESWFAWLEAHTSFSFRGQHGSLSLRKEERPRGKGGYWYAYRRQGRRMIKHYVGSGRKINIARLESLAMTPGGQPHAATPAPRISRQEAILLAKLRPPRLPSTLLKRERLHVLLDLGLERKLTLIWGPAGSGKTTLVNQWMSELGAQNTRPPAMPPPGVAWLSLDPEDNDPVRFWRYVLTACQKWQGAPGRDGLDLLEDPRLPPFALPPLKPILTSFLNDLIDCQGILILEDYHVITTPALHQLVSSLVNHLPSQVHIVILTRSEPPLPLARWRGRNELQDIRGNDLAFSREETQLLLEKRVPFELSSEAITSLHNRLEGWATGLHLLALLLERRGHLQQIESVFATFSGQAQQLLDYFVTEVLDAQPEQLQAFLLHTSILSRLTAPLCDVVMQQDESLALLETAERAGLFLQSIEGTEHWYRYHPLFAQAMQAEARRRLGKETLQEGLRRASVWYEQQGMLPDAVELALRAQDFLHAAHLIEALIGPQRWTTHREYQTLSRWLQQIPESVLHTVPALCFFLATQLTFTSLSDRLATSHLAEIELLLRTAEQIWQREENPIGQGEISAFRALLAVRQGEAKKAAGLARQALSLLPEEQELWRSVCSGAIGGAEHWMGQLDDAAKTHLTVLSRFEATNNYYGKLVTTLMLSDVYRDQGMLYQAAECYQQALAWAQATGKNPSDRAKALLGLAQLYLEWNDLQQAEGAIQEAQDLSSHLTDELLQVQCRLVQAQVLAASGETSQALQLLQTLLAWIDLERLPLLVREIQTLSMQLELSRGNLALVQHWMASRPPNQDDLPMLQYEQEELLRARMFLAQGEPQTVRHLLEPWLASARAAGRHRSALQIQILLAQAHQLLHQTQQARQILYEALAQARVQGYLRLFLGEGEAMEILLRSLVSRVRGQLLRSYLQGILSAFDTQRNRFSPVADPALLIESLSAQERQVLRLLASGLSREEIARMLVISLNTVKTHLQRIYQKLQVHNRVQASEIARHLEQ